MKRIIEITEQELKELKLIRNYFGEHDKTPLEHLAYSELDKLVKKLQQADVIGNVALHIHYDLSLKAMQLMKENNTMKVKDFRELPEVKQLWSAMDVIKQHYL